MKVIIAGCRDITDQALVDSAIGMAVSTCGLEITEVVSGVARGVDTCGEHWAFSNRIPVKFFPADWARDGRSAGPIRNQQMAEYADALIAVWDGKSRGTANMIETARRLGLHVWVSRV